MSKSTKDSNTFLHELLEILKFHNVDLQKVGQVGHVLQFSKRLPFMSKSANDFLIKFLTSKIGHGYRVQFFTMKPFNGKYQNLQMLFFVHFLFSLMYDCNTHTDRQTQKWTNP